MNTVSLAWRLMRGGGRRDMIGSILTFAAVTLVSALLLFAVAGNLAFSERGGRTAWQVPVETTETATAIEAVASDNVAGREIVRIDLAATGDGEAPVPPGMDHFPKPGEVWVSPPLASLMEDLPAAQLADRFPGEPSGELAEDSMVTPADLIAVVGHSPDSAVMTEERFGDDVPPTPIAGYDVAMSNDVYFVYRVLMAIATVLMVVPLLIFGGAAARLTVARRDQRLASLRLIGATGGQVAKLTVIEAVITAFTGALAGTALYFAAAPALSFIPIDGSGWRVSDLMPGPLWVLGVVVTVPLLIGVSAVVGLRRVVVSPLGVARRQTPPSLRVVRLLVVVIFAAAFIAASQGVFGTDGGVIALLTIILLACTFLALNFAGPWVVSVIGRICARLARRPSMLLASRRLIDDPRSAWRAVAGVALTGFVAGFIALLAPLDIVADPDTTRFNVTAAASHEKVIVEAMNEHLTAKDGAPESTVSHDKGIVIVALSAANDTAAADAFRTSIADTAPEADILSNTDSDAEGKEQLTDIRTGIMVVLAVCILIAMVSAAISAASSILDRRQAFGLLHLAGTPMKVLNAARRNEILIPLAIMGGGSVGVGMLLASPFMPMGGFDAVGAVSLAATVIVGTAGILGASALSRPLLRTVMHDTSPRPD